MRRTLATSLPVCIVLMLISLVSLGQGELNLELVQVLFRHGERAPLAKEMYPKDPYNKTDYEPWGLGQLTNQGKMTEYKIGKMLRKRYETFLGELYRPENVYAVSTDVDRTKMSLQLALAGLFPPNPVQTWNANLSWLAIPTHNCPERVDMLLRPHGCPVYEKALEEIKKTDEVRKKVAVHEEFFKFLTDKTGVNIKEPLPVYEIYNLLMAQRTMNLTPPEWCTDEVFKRMQDIVVLEYEIRSFTTELKRKTGGMLIKKFIDNMDLKGERQSPRKIYLYSGHEVNIAAFTRAHNITEPKLPPYGSTVIFEKLRDEHGKVYVRILFWTGATEQLITYKLPGCGEVCPVETYLNLVKDVIPSHEEIVCLWDGITREELENLFAEKLNFN